MDSRIMKYVNFREGGIGSYVMLLKLQMTTSQHVSYAGMTKYNCVRLTIGHSRTGNIHGLSQHPSRLSSWVLPNPREARISPTRSHTNFTDLSVTCWLSQRTAFNSCISVETTKITGNGLIVGVVAHWRCVQVTPAVSVDLGMVSELFNKDEFLQFINLALAKIGSGGDNEYLGSAHMLTRLTAFGIPEFITKSFDVDKGILSDPQTALLTGALLAPREDRNTAMGAAIIVVRCQLGELVEGRSDK
ncbi:hypothetical protein BKA67DRAFT_156345 [Truncatella angustata]|uniref:Uncharacterized protein n=1 Tax=Truncatella angustata TaxID=152316 RepID=A0A9P8UR04_9PEZI|nr:uncharacterized protein BKA67DRAFT_156345 [Truncatella angustata]KAH6656445.1 hypothetical protein BKA67DRAFT_156345 [Truncatella angustata]